MKYWFIVMITLLCVYNNFAQSIQCGSLIYDNFDAVVSLPNEWTEYNSSGQVTIDGKRLKLDYTTIQPAVYRDLAPVSDNFLYAFDVESTRNWVDCKMHLISSAGKYLASYTFGSTGIRNILYATTMNEGIPEGYTGNLLTESYNSNTTYSLSLSANFTDQTIDFYNNGILMVEDVPFLEIVEDVARIDVHLISMYSNEGRFFFDNISLRTVDENRLLLSNRVASGKALLSEVFIGDKCTQYPQSDVDNFETEINAADIILADCQSSSSLIDQMILDLESAKDTFEFAQVNEPVLKIYSDYNFSGEEYDINCGYYNGGLGEYDDLAVSFTLEQGYMVTFAQDINGLGISKVYIAQDESLAINLPEELQNSISFIRVSPWFNTHKKGGSGKGIDVMDSINVSWFYNWGSSGESKPEREFVPMTWSGVPSISTMEALGRNMNYNHHLAFNEPDGPDQANMTVETALEGYKNMLASGLRIGAPAVTHENRGTLWLDEFMAECEARNYRVDFVPAYHYIRRTTNGLYNYLNTIHEKHELPLWLTEYNYGNANYSPVITDEVALTRLKDYNTMLDNTSFIERYSAFYFQPSQGQLSFFVTRNPLVLNEIGEYYRDHETDIAYIQEVYEQGPRLSIEEFLASFKFLAFPTIVNNGILNLKYSKDINISDVELIIYDAIGKEIKKVIGGNEKLDVSFLSKGLYFIRMQSDLQSSTQRIIIQ